MSGAPLPLAADLARTLQEIGALVRDTAAPSVATLQRVATSLEGFVQRHRAALGFDAFPLPAGAGAALCSYELTDPGVRPALRANALRGGSASAVHDHGTWAVIVAIRGRECNRIHRRPAPTSDAGSGLRFVREVWVEPGQPLVLQPQDFHGIHTDAPALQLHLYGQEPETAPRLVFDERRNRLVPLVT